MIVGYIGEVVMRFCALLLSVFLTFGEVSAGNDVSKILTGVAVGVATGGLGYALGPVLGVASIGVEEAVTAGVFAGAATAAGADTRVGVVCNGSGRNPEMRTSFTTRNGETFVFRTGQFNKSRKEAVRNITANRVYIRAHRQVEEKFAESDYQEDPRDDAKFAFDSAVGWDCSRLTSDLRSFDCANNGEIAVFAESDTRGWDVDDGKTIFDSFSVFNPEDDDGQKAVKSFIFEETPLAWHFGREKINGQWYNRAWTDTNMDIMVKEGELINVAAPEWYTNKRRQDNEWFSFSSDKKRVRQELGEGLLEEFGWANVRAIDLLANNRIDEGQEAVKQGLFYYDSAREVLKKRSIHMFSSELMDGMRRFANGEIGVKEFFQNCLSEDFEPKKVIPTVVMTTTKVIPGVKWKVAVAKAGFKAGLRLLRSEIWKELKEVLNRNFVRQEGFAFSGVPNSALRNTTNLRRRVDTPRNVKGSGGSGLGPKAPEEASTKVGTEQDARNYITGLKMCGKLSKENGTKKGIESYEIRKNFEYKGLKFKKGEYVRRDEKELTWLDKNKNSKGKIDSITGDFYKNSGGKERIACTPDEQLNFINQKLSDRSWMKTNHKIGGKEAYYSKEKDLWYTAVKREKNDIEVWRVSGKKAKHQGAMECKKGSMYEGPSHEDQLFE